MTPHRWRDVIVAWANGETVQWRRANSLDDWYDRDDVCGYSFDNKYVEWRIKPKTVTVTYRVALMRGKDLAWATASLGESDEANIEKSETFSRWLTDRITVEV